MGASNYPDRLRIMQLSKKGLTDRQIAVELGLSIRMVRKWRRILKCGGKVQSQMGRPKQGALSSFPAAMRKTWKRWCQQHPGWGAQTLRTELSLCEADTNQRLPSRATLARWLKEAGEVRSHEKHNKRSDEPARSDQVCHAEWEMDARGYSRVPELGLISLIDIYDVYSHVKLLSYPCWVGQKVYPQARLTRRPYRPEQKRSY